jgi:hypothetical protein
MIGRERLGFNEEVLEMAAGVAGQGQIGLFFFWLGRVWVWK